MAILAGGVSRRMGEDKALLRLTPGGPAMLERTIAAARAISSHVLIVSPADRGYAELGAPVVADRFPGEGPLGGIVTALEAAGSEHVLILSCDHPFLSVPLLRWLCEQTSVQLVLPVGALGGREKAYPLLARYRRDALPILASRFTAGERRLQSAIRLLSTRAVNPRVLQRFDPGLRSLINLNTPEDARQASQLLAADRLSERRVVNGPNGAIY